MNLSTWSGRKAMLWPHKEFWLVGSRKQDFSAITFTLWNILLPDLGLPTCLGITEEPAPFGLVNVLKALHWSFYLSFNCLLLLKYNAFIWFSCFHVNFIMPRDALWVKWVAYKQINRQTDKQTDKWLMSVDWEPIQCLILHLWKLVSLCSNVISL